MPETLAGRQASLLDSSRPALELVHRLLLTVPPPFPPSNLVEERVGVPEHAAAVGLLEEFALAAETRIPWAGQLDRALRRQRMDAAVRVVRRLAHDFGNILTAILGFSELALAQQSAPSSALHVYLSELYQGAQSGARYTNQLRQFARRPMPGQRSCQPRAVFTEAEKRWRSLLGAEIHLKLDLPAEPPVIALEAESLREVLAIVLDNAREAIVGAGVIEISVRTVTLTDREACELFGDVRPGIHLEIRMADTGAGLTAQAQQRLFAEPFFSTKPGKRGFGLAIAYGILSAEHGGLELLAAPAGGTIARLLLPLAAGEHPGREMDRADVAAHTNRSTSAPSNR